MIKFSATAEVVSREELRKGGMEKKEEEVGEGRRVRTTDKGRKEEREKSRREGKDSMWYNYGYDTQ